MTEQSGSHQEPESPPPGGFPSVPPMPPVAPMPGGQSDAPPPPDASDTPEGASAPEPPPAPPQAAPETSEAPPQPTAPPEAPAAPGAPGTAPAPAAGSGQWAPAAPIQPYPTASPYQTAQGPYQPQGQYQAQQGPYQAAQGSYQQPGGYVLATPHLPQTRTGLGIGGMVSGIASCVLALTGCCWWPLATLPLVMGVGGVVLGFLGLRQVAESGGEVGGRGLAIAGLATGGAGALLSLGVIALSLLLNASA